ncbi:hypothetical protein BPS10C_132 [Bacillus phage BPS10C]|uniref:Uncharacterized protein n=1 Tax=Bacillus phage BPS10C TaxID=1277886 RepID=W5QUP9_9CAUD|nr:hypothetical protein BPS10C_132 [Bacillus phage BPS10C]AGI12129.1 hypothetical protein BPS10C_132 [Bacillus phage BPS10C]
MRYKHRIAKHRRRHDKIANLEYDNYMLKEELTNTQDELYDALNALRLWYHSDTVKDQVAASEFTDRFMKKHGIYIITVPYTPKEGE